jgi:dUTP pyrophosphatase
MIEIPTFRFALDEGLDSSFLPTRGTDRATGWDVKSAETIFIPDGGYAKINLGFRALCPAGWWLELRPRSSSFVKKSLHALYGVIDEDYEGKMIFACHFLPGQHERFPNAQTTLTVLKGEAIGQLIPVRRQEMIVESVSNEEYDQLCKNRAATRGAGGFGSTSK